MQEWYAYVKVVAKKYKLDPSLCAALAAGESGYKGEEVRFCWVGGGKYHGPYNLARCFLKKWDITDWKVNTEVGIMTLRNKLDEWGNLHDALRHYNTGDSPAQFEKFYNNIKRLWRQYEKRGIFEDRPTLASGRNKLTP
jgi:hypothetical protein